MSIAQFLKARAGNVQEIRMIKVDAQGSDFTIVKDILENFPKIKVRNIQVECQYYDAQAPTYHANNDCKEFLWYVKYKMGGRKWPPTHSFPDGQVVDYTVVRKRDNCPSSEYNVLWHSDDYARINVNTLTSEIETEQHRLEKLITKKV